MSIGRIIHTQVVFNRASQEKVAMEPWVSLPESIVLKRCARFNTFSSQDVAETVSSMVLHGSSSVRPRYNDTESEPCSC